jgi:hypothetical protein
VASSYNKDWLKKWLTWEPHLTLYQEGQVYLERRYVLPRNSRFNIYLHKFLKSDEDEALHDHPWNWCSIILKGHYTEHRQDGTSRRGPGSIVLRKPEVAHRVELDRESTEIFDPNPGRRSWINGPEKSVWTLFITGKKTRIWGFHCPKGWIPWTQFTAGEFGQIRVGCGDHA